MQHGGILDYRKIYISLSKHKTTDNLELKRALQQDLKQRKQKKFLIILEQLLGNQEDKIAKTGVHVTKSKFVDAPIIEEYPLTLECTVESFEDGELIGKIVNCSVDENYLEEKAYKEGKIRAIGISNFEGKYIKELLEKCEIKPQVIQVEAHPYFTQDELRKTLDKENIKLMSWYPLGHGDSKLMNEEIFKDLAKKYNKTPAQIILRWYTQMGFIVIPGTRNVDHVIENFDIFDFKLTNEDMADIAKINKNERYYIRTDEALKHFASWQPEYEK